MTDPNSAGTILDKIVTEKLVEIARRKETISIDALKAQLSEAPPVRNFIQAIDAQNEVSLIAEVKKASPSKGIIRADFHPVSIAQSYESAGATCISCLTDEIFFQGKLEFLTAIREVSQIPILRKDFILDEYQVYEARVAGADAILLIAECLSESRLNQILEKAHELGMTALVELYEESNVEPVVRSGAKLIGVNNRDLRTFEVDLHHTIRMREKIPTDRLLVAESGIGENSEVELLHNAGIDAILVGESLMRQSDVQAAVRKLLGR